MDADSRGMKKEIIAVVIALLVVAGIIVAVVVSANKTSDNTAATESTSTSSTANDTPATPATNASYKDGTYSEATSFSTPGGPDKLTVSLTLKDNVVTAVKADASSSDPESEEYDNRFLAAYEKLVVGKNINDISLSRVSGASLTTTGFNEALTQIKQDAAIS